MDREQILTCLASSLDRKDEQPNISLAEKLVESKDAEAIQHLLHIIHSEKTAYKNDAIKVIYEVGERNPELIAPGLQEFLELLQHKNNRLQWGAMTALQTITSIVPGQVFSNLVLIVDAADGGSVITRDQAMKIMFQLMKIKEYQHDLSALIFEQFRKCPTNQLPMYAEEFALIIPNEFKEEFIGTLRKRLVEIEKLSKIKRIEKVIKKCSIN